MTAGPDDLAAALVGAGAVAGAVIAVLDGDRVGFALDYTSYSTIIGRPGLYLEGLFLSAGHRGEGLYLALLAHLAQIAVQRGYGRLEWWVIRTNEPAIRFYGRLNARGLEEIEVMRLQAELLYALAGRSTTVESTRNAAPS